MSEIHPLEVVRQTLIRRKQILTERLSVMNKTLIDTTDELTNVSGHLGAVEHEMGLLRVEGNSLFAAVQAPEPEPESEPEPETVAVKDENTGKVVEIETKISEPEPEGITTEEEKPEKPPVRPDDDII